LVSWPPYRCHICRNNLKVKNKYRKQKITDAEYAEIIKPDVVFERLNTRIVPRNKAKKAKDFIKNGKGKKESL